MDSLFLFNYLILIISGKGLTSNLLALFVLHSSKDESFLTVVTIIKKSKVSSV